MNLCPHALACGGCPLIDLPHDQQWAGKLGSLEAELAARGLSYPAIESVFGDSSLGYRNRLRLRVDSAGSVDFFNPQKARGCAVLEPELEQLIERLRRFSREGAALSGVDHVEVRGPDDDGMAGVCLVARGAAIEPTALQALGSDVAIGIAGGTMPRQRRTVADDAYCLVPLDGFLQVNSQVNRRLVSTLRELALRYSLTSFVDLFAGSGNFSLPLARSGLSGLAVELSASSCHALSLAAAEQGLKLEVLTADVSALAERRELLIIDAPRAGVRDGLAELADGAERCVALVSCNAATFARDLQVLSGAGFELAHLVAFDMFPHTVHLEVLGWLVR